ncbi:hypothetical protein [Alkaliphilus hydrothermalis]|uniref:Tight adherence protein B n=1 Tax=Alkaliphilus hydrothermalis TaxID=1482730 RepID=A0ABS2NL06_9FIRM|nr:hypothetical protein [Alkaliphilus hydrothermalis]MBM7613598.1 hypothetical protein [Alkaliphilus hydrothermalis]
MKELLQENLSGGLFILVAISLVVTLGITKLNAHIRKRRYLIRRNPVRIYRQIYSKLCNFRLLEKFLDSIALRISVLNDDSYETNQEKAVIALILLALVIIINFTIVLPNVQIVWYLYLFYMMLGGVFLLCVLYTLELMLRMHFTKLLPNTYKILNSRFTTEGDILKAIDRSLIDVNPTIRREMVRIRNVLRKNDPSKIDETFSLMEKIYNNEYFTLLLNLIQQAYYKGGRDSVKQQFEIVTEEILIDIENKKDLALTSRMYVVIALFLPLGVNWLENFNDKALGEASLDFYSSPIGVSFKILLLTSMLIYIVSLLFLERTA